MTRLFHTAATAAVLLVASLPTPASAAVTVREPVKREAPPAPRQEVPGIVLAGMAFSGLIIVGIAARRRQPGRRVTS